MAAVFALCVGFIFFYICSGQGVLKILKPCVENMPEGKGWEDEEARVCSTTSKTLKFSVIDADGGPRDAVFLSVNDKYVRNWTSSELGISKRGRQTVLWDFGDLLEPGYHNFRLGLAERETIAFSISQNFWLIEEWKSKSSAAQKRSGLVPRGVTNVVLTPKECGKIISYTKRLSQGFVEVGIGGDMKDADGEVRRNLEVHYCAVCK